MRVGAQVQRKNGELMGYDEAQVCPNGHVSNEHVLASPQSCREYCEECGERTLSTCPACSVKLRGGYFGVWGGFDPPAYCYGCGAAFPWTERRIQAAIELVADELSEAEAAQFADSVKSIAQNTPATEVDANRIRKLLGNLPAYLTTAAEKLVIEISSEAIAKIITQRA